mgnify:FL=1
MSERLVIPVDSNEVFASPEWIAFSDRFGIPHGVATRRIDIRLAVGELMEVTHVYFGGDARERRWDE